LQADVDVVRIIGNMGVREVAYRAIMLGRWIIIFYKDAFAIEVGKFWTFFSDEVHFARLKVGWENESEWSHCGRGCGGVVFLTGNKNNTYDSILLK
jgi:hypothetical protein